MKTYEIVKHFQGGMGTYYASMGNKQKMRRGCWDYQLDEWGEGTAGGHGYGYTIKATRIKGLPKKNKMKLEFNKYYLENRDE